MNDIQVSKVLGLVAVGIGSAELFYGSAVQKALGLPLPSLLVRILGVREIVSGCVAIAHADNPGPIGARLAGDAMDLAILGAALQPGNPKRSAAGLATLAVLGITAMDALAVASLAKRQSTAMRTAERTRVKVLPA